MMKMHAKIMKIYTEKKDYVLIGAALLAYIFLFILFALLRSTPASISNDNELKNHEESPLISTDLSSISRWHLFGVNELEKFSNSNIKLVGIIFENNSSKAIILVNSEERILKNGDKINSNFTVQKIEPSRVVIDTNEGLQQMGLFEETPTQAGLPNEAAPPPPSADMANNNDSGDYNKYSENNPELSNQTGEQEVSNSRN